MPLKTSKFPPRLLKKKYHLCRLTKMLLWVIKKSIIFVLGKYVLGRSWGLLSH